MQWDDIGYLISKNRYNENSIIAEFYTKNHGKSSGIIFGATSNKIKNYLQIGNKLYLNYNYKNEGKLGYYKVEIFKAYTPYYFDYKEKLLCIISAMSLVKLLTSIVVIFICLMLFSIYHLLPNQLLYQVFWLRLSIRSFFFLFFSWFCISY